MARHRDEWPVAFRQLARNKCAQRLPDVLLILTVNMQFARIVVKHICADERQYASGIDLPLVTQIMQRDAGMKLRHAQLQFARRPGMKAIFEGTHKRYFTHRIFLFPQG